MKNKKLPTTPAYMRVIATEGDSAADLLLYGVIGQDFWWDESLNEESLTDLAVVRKIKELEGKYSRINIRINSPGGNVYHGDAIIAAIRNSTAEIHAYNDGWAASMAADIWISCPNRHMAINAKLMFHATSTYEYGNTKQLRRAADMLEKMDEAAIAMMAESTGKTADDIRQMFYADYEDHYLTRAEAMELGLLTDTEEYKSETPAPDMQKLSYTEVMRHFQQQGEKEDESFLERMKSKWQQWQKELLPPAKINNHKTEILMNAEELTRSLTAGEITHEEVADVLRQGGFNVEAPATDAPADAVDVATLLRTTMAEVLKPLTDRIGQLEGELQKVGGQPGATITTAKTEGDPANADIANLTDEEKATKVRLDKMNEEFKAAFKNRESLHIVPASVKLTN